MCDVMTDALSSQLISSDTLSLTHAFQTLKHEIWLLISGKSKGEEIHNQLRYVTTSPSLDASDVSSMASEVDAAASTGGDRDPQQSEFESSFNTSKKEDTKETQSDEKTSSLSPVYTSSRGTNQLLLGFQRCDSCGQRPQDRGCRRSGHEHSER
jgi:hypothetical protein